MIQKKILATLVVFLFLASATGGLLKAGESQRQTENYQVFSIETSNSFSQPIITETDYCKIKLNEANSNTVAMDGMPFLPAKTEVYRFPMGVRITEVTAEVSSVSSQRISTIVEPAPIAKAYGLESEWTDARFEEKSEQPYDYAGFYPQKWMDYSIRVGLDENNERTTFLITKSYPVRYSYEDNTILYADDIDITVQYEQPTVFAAEQDAYDLLIIAAPSYLDELQDLVAHKENRGIRTKMVSTEDIDTNGRDLTEQIKYYIKKGIEEWNITYVLLVGGYRSFIGIDNPKVQVPLRFIHLDDGGEPGYVSDMYYADIYQYNNDTGMYEFGSWDTDNDGKYGEWYGEMVKEDEVDLLPDVHLGRLACRTQNEVKTMVSKIITYENNDYTNQDWFKKMTVISGDDFQDQNMLDIAWDTTELNGEYTIHATCTNMQGETGPEDTVTVFVDHSSDSVVSFSEDDHLIADYQFPHPPIAEITVPADGDTLGNGDVTVNKPRGAYIGYRWTPINYEDKIMHIRGKGYNPQVQQISGANTTFTVWITDEQGEKIFGPVSQNSSQWMEGEWATGKALDFMPEDYEKETIWVTEGTFHGTEEDPHNGMPVVIDALAEGAGYVYIAGHANPMIFANHYPGVCGGRQNGDIEGLTQFDYNANFWQPKELFPLQKITNGDKLPIMVLSGCHPVQLDVSFMRLLTEGKSALWYGTFIWECLGWWLTRLDNGGTIATMGPTGLGYGNIGKWGTEGLGGWLWPEFFRIHKQENVNVLGEVYSQAFTNYVHEFGPDLDLIDTKTVEEMVLLGDPTLTIG